MTVSLIASKLPVPLRFAVRELRGGLTGFRVFLACLILGVAAIAAVGSLTRAIQEGMLAEGQALLGGDVEVSLFQQQATVDELAFFKASGDVSASSRLRTMARAITTQERTLVELRAVDGAYPLYGDLVLAPAIPPADAFAKRGEQWGAAIPPFLAERLKVGVGDTLRIGQSTFEVRALLEQEPDRSNQGFLLGPTVMVSTEAMPETGLVRLGSLIRYYYKVRMPETVDLAAWKAALEERFPDADWRLRDRSNGAPGVRTFIERMGMFLTLVGLTALAVGGVGVGNAVRTYLDGKTDTIATLKILGAEGGVVFRIYLAQIMLLAAAAVVVGLLLGALTPVAAVALLDGQLPVPPRFGLFPEPLITAAVYGLLITLAFAVWPLGRARDVPAARLFRTLVAPEARWPRPQYLAIVGGAVAAVIAAAVGLADLKDLAAGFVAGAVGSLILLRLTGWAIQAGVARLPRPRRPGLRLAIANITRPGAATGAIVLSLGLGLTLFATLALVEGNLNRQVRAQLPDEAPAFFFVDIQTYQLEDFRQAVDGLDGAGDLVTVPSLRGQIVRVDGVPADQVDARPDVRWVLRGDRGLSYTATVPDANSIVAGQWWPQDYAGPPLVSFGAEQAAGLGLAVGDTVTLSILGREVTATIANLRTIDWGTFGFNFVVLFAPGTLETFPHTHMATLKATGEVEAQAHRTLTDAFPNITAVRMKEVFATIDGLLGEIGTAVRATAVVTILAGILVLAGAMAAGHRHRVYDSVIMKVLGAVRRDVLRAYLLEYVALGLVTGVIALGLGAVAGWVVVDTVMDMDFVLLPGAMAATVAASIMVTVFFGLLGTWRALSARPAVVLRAA